MEPFGYSQDQLDSGLKLPEIPETLLAKYRIALEQKPGIEKERLEFVSKLIGATALELAQIEDND